MQAKVRELEEKCRSQSEQFGMLSQELDKFRVQASKIDLSGPGLLSSPSLTQLTNGVGLYGETGTLKSRSYTTHKGCFCVLSDLNKGFCIKSKFAVLVIYFTADWFGSRLFIEELWAVVVIV